MFDPEYLRARLSYNPETGELWWRYVEGGNARHNARWANKRAFTSCNIGGHLHGMLDGKIVLARNIAWALYYGVNPTSNIGYANGDKLDLRIANLRMKNHLPDVL